MSTLTAVSFPYKVMYLSRFSEIGGAERSLHLLLKGLNRQRFHPFVVLPAPGPFADLLSKDGIETQFLPLQKLKAKYPWRYLETVYRLFKVIRENNINIIHCNMELCNQYGLLAARISNIPIICHTRNYPLGRRAFKRMFLNYADILIAISETVASGYEAYLRNNKRVAIIYNGIDLAKFSPSLNSRKRWRERLRIPGDAFVIGLLGRIVPQKGQHIFIKAMNRIVKVRPNVYGLIVGGTEIDNTEWYKEELETLIQEFRLTENVRLNGFIQDILSLYSSIDLLVVPCLEDACGRTALEAMAMQKPIVASAVGSASEIVEDGKTALLVPPGDPEALADTILSLIDDNKLAIELGKNGRKRVEKLFDIREHVRQIEELYLKILGIRP